MVCNTTGPFRKGTFLDSFPFSTSLMRLSELTRPPVPCALDSDEAWACYVKWASSCWKGRVEDMLEEMRRHQEALGHPPKDCDEKDPRKVLAEAITYFENNASRMDYPRYRKEGLPLTSA